MSQYIFGTSMTIDEAVFAAYGWKSDLSDEEILEKLLALLPTLRFGSASLNLVGEGKII